MRYEFQECPGMCLACPFACSEESEMANNYGCLPDPQEILYLKRTTGGNWSCHEDGTKICAGFVAAAKEFDIDYKSGFLIDAPRYLGFEGYHKVIRDIVHLKENWSILSDDVKTFITGVKHG